MTPEERRARDRERYAANPEPKKARAREYRRNSPEKAAAAVENWKQANPERVRELGRQIAKRYAANHPDRVQANCARWRAANPEHRQNYMQVWRAANPELVAEHHKRRRARKKGASGDGFACLEDLRDAIEIGWENSCCYCNAKFDETNVVQIDHIVPLSKGGSHRPENLAPACAQCNNSKGAKLLSEWRDGKYALSVPEHATNIAAVLRER